MSDQFKRSDSLLKHKMKKYLLAMIFQSASLNLAHLVDSYMIARYLGSRELVALTIGEISDYITDIPHCIFGIGGMILVSALWGDGKKEEADQVFSASMLGCIILGFMITVLSFAAGPLASLLTGKSDVALTADVANYFRITFAISPFVVAGLCLSKFISTDGFPELTSYYYFTANALNLIMDFFFFKYTSLGVKGAALSTGLGYIIASILFIEYFRNTRRMLRFTPLFEIHMCDVKSSFKAGSPNMLNLLVESGLNSVRTIIVTRFFGVLGMLYLTLYRNLKEIINLFTEAVINQLRVLTSVLYAERDYYGVKKITYFVIRTVIVIALFFTVFTMLFPNRILAMFSITEYHSELCLFLRISAIALPGYQLLKFFWNYYQSIQSTRLAYIVSVVQNHVIETALLGITGFFALLFGFDSYSFLPFCTIADPCIALLCIIFFVKLILKSKNLLIIETENTADELDLTLQADDRNAAAVSKRICDFCIEKGIAANKANILGIAGEEIVVSIITFMENLHGYIDLNIRLVGNQAVMRVRDDGKPFNPLNHESRSLYDIDSIVMLKKLAKEIHYTRAMDMNNTLIILDIR